VSKYAGGRGEALPWGLVMTVRVLIRALAAVSGEAELLRICGSMMPPKDSQRELPRTRHRRTT
jgi:hypothetical protein